MDTFDYKKEFKSLYTSPSKKPVLVDVPSLNFLAIDGQGDPNGSGFEAAVGALYAVAYTIKMLPKRGITPPGYLMYSVPPLEGLWKLPEGEMYSPEAPKDAYI